MSSLRGAPRTAATAKTPTGCSTTTSIRSCLKPSPPDVQQLYLQSYQGPRHRTAGARHPLCGGRLGIPHPGGLRPGVGSLAGRHGNHPVHLFPDGRQHRAVAHVGGADLRSGADRHVPAGRRQRLRPASGTRGSDMAMCTTSRRWSSPPTISSRPTSTCCSAFSTATRPNPSGSSPHGLVLPAYEYCLKCSHTFNLLDARGAISVTERTGYIAPHPQPGPGRARRPTWTSGRPWGFRW